MDPRPVEITTPSDLEVRIVREFAAPRRLVAAAFTRCDLLQRWMGVFGDWAWASCESDPRAGGTYRYVWRQPDGTQLALSGRYLEVVADERYVFTQRYEAMAEFPNEMLVTTLFSEAAGRTHMEMTSRYATKAERDLDLQYMPAGLEPGFVLLDRVLAEEAA
jgi:uncharacterized protein YndB with AHSA1/START domain